MSNREEVTALFKKYIANQCDDEEGRLVFELLDAEEYELLFKDLIDVELAELAEERFKASAEVKATLAQVKRNIILQLNEPKYKKNAFNKVIWIKATIAAVLLLCMGLAILFHDQQDVSTGIAQGENKAVLTLADGSKIILDDSALGDLSNQAGIKISQTDEGKLIYSVGDAKSQNEDESNAEGLTNTITTPRGGQYQVNLPDGTKVWLNAESVLKFPLHFSKSGDRKVELQGEAYFEVAKVMKKNGAGNERIPFVVKTGIQEVEVLGTHFNINAYPSNHETKTTLLEGAVRVKLLKGTEKDYAILKPGQQSQLSAFAEKVKVVDVDPLNEIAWKNGQFFFENESIASIMQEIARWYDVEVIYQDDLSTKTVWGSVTRYTNISKVLSILELTGGIHFKVEGRRVVVQK